MPGNLVLRVLYDPSKAGGVTPDLDVVFVHGLAGDLTKTWTHPSGVQWPRHLLKVERPLTRVMAYGYDGSTYDTGSVAGIRQHARTLLERVVGQRDDDWAESRPVIFVAHCLGGLIVKQALCFANSGENADFDAVAGATAGVLLFGTPNFGTTTEQIKANALAFGELEKMPGPSDSRPLAGLAEAIVQHSADLQEIQEDFTQLQSRYEIAEWFETRRLAKASVLVVEPSSACYMGPDQRRFQVDADHINMCKFADTDDGTFREVCLRIKFMVKAYKKAKAAVVDDRTSSGLVRGRYGAPEKFQLAHRQDNRHLPAFMAAVAPGVRRPLALLESPGQVEELEPVWRQDSRNFEVETLQGTENVQGNTSFNFGWFFLRSYRA